MRQLLVLLVLVAVPLVAGTVTRTATFDRGDLLISPQNGFDNVELRGAVALVQLGAPRVPRVVEALAIPAGAVPVGISLGWEKPWVVYRRSGNLYCSIRRSNGWHEWLLYDGSPPP